MTDLNILVFGCAVSFIAAAGAYVILRQRFSGADSPRTVELTARSRRREDEPRPVRVHASR